MTGNGNPTSGHNLVCFTLSGIVDQTAHTSIKIVEKSCLQQLVVPLFDSKSLENLNF
jgi:hypothetical protein